MNTEQISGKWRQFMGEAKKQWGKLTDDHWAQINGNNDVLAGKIKEAYGISKEEAEKQIREFEARNAANKNRAA